MAVTRTNYATREEIKAVLDVKTTARSDNQVDEAADAASDSIEGFLHRQFYPTYGTWYFDWPNFQYAYPWRLWLDQYELAAIPTAVTTGGTQIPLSACNFEPVNSGPPFTYLELRRDLNYGFGVGPTPQRDIAITGPKGFWANTVAAGALAVAMSDTTGTAVTVTNSAAVGVGDNILTDTERMIVTDKAMVSTGQTQQSGLTTNSVTDVALGVTDGTKYFPGETLLLDSERLLVVDIVGNVLTVKRPWDGSIIAAHTGATIYAQRLLTVQRGALGTTAATHLINTAVNRGLVPGLVKQLHIAESVVAVTLGPAAYATRQGSGPSAQSNVGAGVPDVRDRCLARFGRKSRVRVV